MTMSKALNVLSVDEQQLILLMRIKRTATFDLSIASGKPQRVQVPQPDFLQIHDPGLIKLETSDQILLDYIRFVKFGRLTFAVTDGKFYQLVDYRLGLVTSGHKTYLLSSKDPQTEVEEELTEEYNDPESKKQNIEDSSMREKPKRIKSKISKVKAKA